MLKKVLKSLQIGFLHQLKKVPGCESISFITGQVELEHYVAKTGETIYEKLPMELINYNTVDNNLKYALAALISTTGNTRWIGTNSLIDGYSSQSGKDGILETSGVGEFPYITTKDSGGAGSQNWVKFKGVRTAQGAETHTSLGIGLNIVSDYELGTEYASQTISKTLALNDVLTVYWTLTAS